MTPLSCAVFQRPAIASLRLYTGRALPQTVPVQHGVALDSIDGCAAKSQRQTDRTAIQRGKRLREEKLKFTVSAFFHPEIRFGKAIACSAVPLLTQLTANKALCVKIGQ